MLENSYDHNLNLNSYADIIFDCDGVLINSNEIKTDAFFEFAKRFGLNVAKKFTEFHKANGGQSRYQKIRYLYNEMLGENITEDKLLDEADRFGALIFEKLKVADVAENLDVLRRINKKAKWCVVSGSDQNELQQLFRLNGLRKYFGDKIFGSPRSKEQIIREQMLEGSFSSRTLFIGDSEYDYISAKHFGFDFVYLSAWSEWAVDEPNALFHCRENITDLCVF